MASKQLFGSAPRGKKAPKADTTNLAGGKAYILSSKQALAQMAATGCLGDTFYATAESQLDDVLRLAGECEPEFVAKVAIYARQSAFMKDMPALLLAHLASRGDEGVALCGQTFAQVVDNGRMLRNFVQIVRSGKTGRKSLGTAPKRFIRSWLASRADAQVFRDTVGKDPSMVDIIKMVHPVPETDSRRALYGHLLGRDTKPNGHKGWNPEALPHIVKAYEAYKKDRSGEPPRVPFQMLDSLGLGKAEWTKIARDAKWQMTRMNLNTFKRHGVLDDPEMVKLIATRLADPEQVKQAKVFPYQLLTAYKYAEGMPFEITEALQDALDAACSNIPEIEGNVFIFPDTSGSMHSPITGRRGVSSKVTCLDVASVISAALLKRNRRARVMPFADRLKTATLNPRDSVMTTAAKLAQLGGGGTACQLPLEQLVKENAHVDFAVFVSDYESWIDPRRGGGGFSWGNDGTATMRAWEALRARNPKAKLMCINVTPDGTTQTPNRKDILNVGGFSDSVFDLMALFAGSDGGDDHWVNLIEREVSLG